MLPFLLAGHEVEKGQENAYIAHHSLNGPAWEGAPPFITKAMVVMAIGAVLLWLVAAAVKRSVARDPSVPRGFLRNSLEALVLFIRNDMVRPAMGAHHGDRYVPFFCTIFLFILVLNLLGMVPIPKVGFTATSTLSVTIPLALTICAVSLVSGFVFHGAGGFFKLFVPSGLPVLLVPVLFLLEIVGFFIKHGVLAIRLFANMIAGHLVIGAFLGLIFVYGSYGVAIPAVLLALFVSFLELLVAFLQAYVFTLLSVLFVGGMVHPEH